MSQAPPIRFVVVGTGLIGPRHAEAILNIADARLACIVDPHPSAVNVASKLQCPLYPSIQSMLDDSIAKPDAALVCTPNHTHVAVSKELLQAGIHVLCEKPISIDAQSGQELIECARAYNRHLLIGHHRRFNRYVVAVKHHLPSLGRLIAINALWTIFKPASYFDPPTEWRRLDSAGPIFINLIHEIDLLHYWYGPITRVYAEQAPSQRDFDAEEGCAITLRFASGMVGTFLLADAVVSPHNFEAGTGENPLIPYLGRDFQRVFGSNGSMSVPDMIRWEYSGEKSWTAEMTATKLDVPEMKIPFEAQIEHFVGVIRGVEEPRCDGREGLRAVVVCEAIKASMRRGEAVEIAETL
ncbi:quinate utilization oxidoreductase QutH [Paraphoma chrysanthemicola]|uniref:Quinate utilization oxidoreductase QutH n=1 Tax=Paraphoma chrysanthemicola TaxID=798071 RepID=A0A8K0R9Z1_9PLEO|nr:quinate utilization oxidoreductase QutH [Paraphoma chrysanthemicola]